MLRVACYLAGVALLAATAHVTITYSGGYTQPGAIQVIAIAMGVGVGALAFGTAWSLKRRALAVWLVLALIAGEAFGFLLTAERLVNAREASQAPMREASAVYTMALGRVASAEDGKAAADTAVIEKLAERGCAANCRQLLQAQVDSAQRELYEARAALAAIQAPGSATPLADRLGWPAWVLDLVVAGLGSMAANGLGVGLIAFAAHGHGPLRQSAGVDAATLEPAPRKTVVRELEHAAQFAIEALAPTHDGEAELLAIHGAYRDWCQAKGIEPLPAAQIGSALDHLFDGTGITITERNGRRVALGVAVKSQPKRKALGHMAKVGAAARQVHPEVALRIASGVGFAFSFRTVALRPHGRGSGFKRKTLCR